MAGLGVILGSSALGAEGEAVVAAAEAAGAAVVARHGGGREGGGGYTLPHRLDHAGNLRPLAEAGCKRVLAVGSVGSLRPEIEVGSFLCPDDFIALQSVVTTRKGPSAHTTHGFDPEWRRELLAAWSRAGGGGVRDGGVYWQTNGPRFETPAEIRLIAPHAHVVGMTLASECVVAGELGLRYTAVCVVDNMANGVAARPLTTADVERDRAANAARLRAALAATLPALAR